MRKNWIGLVLCVMLLPAFVHARASKPRTVMRDQSGISIGPIYDNILQSVIPYLQIYSRGYTVGFGGNGFYRDRSVEHKKNEKMNLVGHLGFRAKSASDLFMTFGVSGTYMIKEDTKNAYLIGPFSGVDFNLAKHILLTGQVMPYAYRQRDIVQKKSHLFFQKWQLGIAYAF
ncbi:MAG: hypothetical protein K9M07_02385 [Simkaniaceae bacterium]|nr:hypothetical protein [Simkaniaceae bacterium]